MFNLVLLLLSSGFLNQQSGLQYVKPSIVQGVIVNENKLPVNKAHVYTVHGEEETFSDEKGGFTLRTSLALPFKLHVQYDGYSEQVIELTTTEKEITVQLTRK